ncbi:MAG: EamA family transporter [Patescibacteria group bacterium]
MNFYFYIFGTTICYVLGDFFGKMWSVKNTSFWLASSLAIYFLGSVLFISAIKKSSLSLAVATAPLAIALTGILFGYFYFGERLSIFQYLGIGLGVIALALLLLPIQTLVK